MSAAASGDLFRLTYQVGVLADALDRVFERLPILLSPHEWKGQLDKKALAARIWRALETKYRDHEADAVGIGLHIQGRL